MFEKPYELQAGLIAQWEIGGLLSIGQNDILLEGALRRHVEAFDFTTIKDLLPKPIMDQHRVPILLQESAFPARRYVEGGLISLHKQDGLDFPERPGAWVVHFLILGVRGCQPIDFSDHS